MLQCQRRAVLYRDLIEQLFVLEAFAAAQAWRASLSRGAIPSDSERPRGDLSICDQDFRP